MTSTSWFRFLVILLNVFFLIKALKAISLFHRVDFNGNSKTLKQGIYTLVNIIWCFFFKRNANFSFVRFILLVCKNNHSLTGFSSHNIIVITLELNNLKFFFFLYNSKHLEQIITKSLTTFYSIATDWRFYCCWICHKRHNTNKVIALVKVKKNLIIIPKFLYNLYSFFNLII